MSTMVDITHLADDKFRVDPYRDWVKDEGIPAAQPRVSSVAVDHRVSRN